MVRKWTYDEAYELLKPYESDFFMSIMLAQFNLESVMGTSELATKANNFTGHKTTGWNGKVYKKDTIEDDGKGNKFVAKSEPFRKYKTPSEWAKHHASWLQRLPDTYTKAINAKTVEEQAQALQGTYATDTAYAKKLLDIIERDGLKKYDEKKGTDTKPIFDYHCHLPPQQIAEDYRFKNLYDIWLKGDHYKWRAMRTNGDRKSVV